MKPIAMVKGLFIIVFLMIEINYAFANPGEVKSRITCDQTRTNTINVYSDTDADYYIDEDSLKVNLLMNKNYLQDGNFGVMLYAEPKAKAKKCNNNRSIKLFTVGNGILGRFVYGNMKSHREGFNCGRTSGALAYISIPVFFDRINQKAILMEEVKFLEDNGKLIHCLSPGKSSNPRAAGRFTVHSNGEKTDNPYYEPFEFPFDVNLVTKITALLEEKKRIWKTPKTVEELPLSFPDNFPHCILLMLQNSCMSPY